MRKKAYIIGAAIGAILAIGAVFMYTPLKVRRAIDRLQNAPDAEVSLWAERVAALGDVAIPRLVECLQHDEPACRNARRALAHVVDSWPADDPRAAQLSRRIVNDLNQLSASGSGYAVELCELMLEKHCSIVADNCSELATAGLKSGHPSCRAAAISLAARPELGRAAEAVPLLNDPEPTVRRVALVAIGGNRDLIGDEDLLRWLHDTDDKVRLLCVEALRLRGLSEKQITMGRLVTDASFLRRMEVIRFLPGDRDIDPGVWLMRLSQDQVPAVRAAAARVATDQELRLCPEFVTRLHQMSQDDPDGTVRQIARTCHEQASRRLKYPR